MTKRKILVIGVVIILVAASFLLITGSSILTKSILKNFFLPLGNLIAWAGIISLQLTIYIILNKLKRSTPVTDKILRVAIIFLIILAILWAPLCYFLSGNLAFAFTETDRFQGGQKALKFFWYFNYFLIAAPILLLVMKGILVFVTRKHSLPEKSKQER
jgi:hypothetical protein